MASWVVLGAGLVLAAAWDLRARRIPDGLTLPLAAAGLLLHAWRAGLGDLGSGALGSACGAVLGAAPLAYSAWRGGLGWGDVKLMAAVGAVMGLSAMVTTTVCVALVGAVQATVVLLWNGEAAAAATGLLGRGPGTGRSIPYGIAIALGTAWSMWWQYPPVELPR
jgi:prepilin peptidase CpaA